MSCDFSLETTDLDGVRCRVDTECSSEAMLWLDTDKACHVLRALYSGVLLQQLCRGLLNERGLG